MKSLIKIFLCCLSLIMLTNAMPLSASAYDVNNFDKISEQIEKQVEDYHIPAMAVIVVDSDEVLFSETYGNCESVNTPFIIGSMSKSFTALSIMQLVEENKISLDAPISDYIDTSIYLKNASEGDKITVRQLLNQTSGLDTYQRFGNAAITDTYNKYLYANVNYGLLGKIIEAVSGQSYSDYVEQNIFIPLEMDKSSATLENSKADGLIEGYRNYFGIPVAGDPDYPDDSSWSIVPAGYISSSVEDMGKYLQMYLNGGNNIVSSNSIETMFYDNVQQDDSGLLYYGMGWMLSEQFDEPMLTHSGLVENYTSNMFIFPESGIGIVVLVNMNDYLVCNNLLTNIVQPLLGEEVQVLSGNPYITNHIIFNAVYLLIFIISVLPIIFISSWKKKNYTKKTLFLDIIRHGVLPIALIMLPNLLGIPLWVVWYFVKDLFIVLTASAILLLCVGIYKMIFRFKHKSI